MHWALGGIVLLSVGVLMRRALQLDVPPVPPFRGLLPLTAGREAIYQPVAFELETRDAILGVALNDAMEERDSGNHEIAWRLLRLSADEWDCLAEIVVLLLNVVTKHMPVARVVLPVRNMVSHRFKSRIMVDYVRMHELLDQLVFRSKLRYQLHIRVLRRAVETLAVDFHRTQRLARRPLGSPGELWSRLDLDFHDFDLITKEALLAFRAFLTYLPDDALSDVAADLRPLLERGVRRTSIPSGR